MQRNARTWLALALLASTVAGLVAAWFIPPLVDQHRHRKLHKAAALEEYLEPIPERPEHIRLLSRGNPNVPMACSELCQRLLLSGEAKTFGVLHEEKKRNFNTREWITTYTKGAEISLVRAPDCRTYSHMGRRLLPETQSALLAGVCFVSNPPEAGRTLTVIRIGGARHQFEDEHIYALKVQQNAIYRYDDRNGLHTLFQERRVTSRPLNAPLVPGYVDKEYKCEKESGWFRFCQKLGWVRIRLGKEPVYLEDAYRQYFHYSLEIPETASSAPAAPVREGESTDEIATSENVLRILKRAEQREPDPVETSILRGWITGLDKRSAWDATDLEIARRLFEPEQHSFLSSFLDKVRYHAPYEFQVALLPDMVPMIERYYNRIPPGVQMLNMIRTEDLAPYADRIWALADTKGKSAPYYLPIAGRLGHDPDTLFSRQATGSQGTKKQVIFGICQSDPAWQAGLADTLVQTLQNYSADNVKHATGPSALYPYGAGVVLLEKMGRDADARIALAATQDWMRGAGLNPERRAKVTEDLDQQLDYYRDHIEPGGDCRFIPWR